MLKAHPFLRYDSHSEVLRVEPGSWDVRGNMLLPEGVALHISAGTRLNFSAGASLQASGPLHFEGSSESPITLGAIEDTWGGVLVVGSSQSTVWSNVQVLKPVVLKSSDLDSGGVTFYSKSR